MKIALVGSRGIPARYSGFETFYEQLGVRLAARGHEVTVYNRSHFIKDVRESYRGVRLVTLPSIPTKHLDTLTHTLVSSLHALTQGYDIVYYSIVGNSPLVWIPRMAGAKTLLNVDGEDWAREKWGRFARWYQLQCEKIACRTAHVIIADAREVRRRYRDMYRTESIFVPYGGNLAHSDATATLDRWGLQKNGYIFYVGRFVPENAIDLLIRSFRALDTSVKLVITGDAPYMNDYKKQLHDLAAGDNRIVFTGYAFGDDYAQLSSHALLYVQPSGIEGTRPALLDQLGFGNCVVVRNSAANMEVLGGAGYSFDREQPESSLREILRDLLANPDKIELMKPKARERIATYYNWEWITDFHIDLFARLKAGKPAQSYDDYLNERCSAASKAS
jgi:glycosyltransferase involved in cell wall biosynthesis